MILQGVILARDFDAVRCKNALVIHSFIFLSQFHLNTVEF